MSIAPSSSHSRDYTGEMDLSTSVSHRADSMRPKKPTKRCSLVGVLGTVAKIAFLIIGTLGSIPVKADPVSAMATLRANKESHNVTVVFKEICVNCWRGYPYPSDVFLTVNYMNLRSPASEDILIFLYNNIGVRNCPQLKQNPVSQGKVQIAVFKPDDTVNPRLVTKKFWGNMVENFGDRMITFEKPSDPDFFLCGWVTTGPA